MVNVTENGAGGFVAGTLVHTKEGLKPIEEIRVGDWVLSKYESGQGEQAYKRVVNTFVHEDKEIWFFRYCHMDTMVESHIYGTANHPVWVKDKGWTSIEFLIPLGADRECASIEAEDGSEAIAYLAYPVYATAEKDIGFRLSERAELKAYPGIRIDFSDGFSDIESQKGHEFLFRDELAVVVEWNKPLTRHELAEVAGNKALTFKHRVYNIEVEDFHTYYVGPHGIWVHNTNCASVTEERGRCAA